MKRRDSLKTLLVGGVAGTAIATTGCKTDNPSSSKQAPIASYDYGRTPEERTHDEKVLSQTYFSEHELNTIAVLCDIILPDMEGAGSATDAGVPEFIEFIVKDLPYQQLPLRGGLMWLDGESTRRFNEAFIDCSDSQQLQIVEDIAYPNKQDSNPAMGPGIQFFTNMRNLTLTGYYTSKMGFDDLGYVGNQPNLWDGVPEEVLKEHQMSYDEAWLAKCINHDTRETIAEWDDDGNLIT